MTAKEAREYLTAEAERIEKVRAEFDGATKEWTKAEVNAFIAGACQALQRAGVLTHRESMELFTDLWRI